jgi:hypothetical protein
VGKQNAGQGTMEMVQRYVHLAQVDIGEAHRRASPVYNTNCLLNDRV